MRGIRFINQLCKEFNLKINKSGEGYSNVFHVTNCQNHIFYYKLSGLYILWISRRKIALLIRNTGPIRYFLISEKYKIFQLIYDDLCVAQDL